MHLLLWVDLVMMYWWEQLDHVLEAVIDIGCIWETTHEILNALTNSESLAHVGQLRWYHMIGLCSYIHVQSKEQSEMDGERNAGT